MTQTLGIDFAWARPSGRAVASAGYTLVMGYLSGGGTKDLTAADIAAYRAAGLQVGLVWETSANRALSGAAGGRADGAAAEAQANSVGYPADCVVFAAVDFAASLAQIDGPIRDYMLGFNQATRRPVGVYGSYDVVSRLCTPGKPPIAYAWQTMAWSGGRLWQSAHLFQRLAHTYLIAGVAATDWDEDVLLNPLPLYGANQQEADLTGDEHNMLQFIHDALLTGGASMPDAGKSLPQSVLDSRLAILDWLQNTTGADLRLIVGTLNTLSTTVGEVQAPQIDEAKLAAALLANPQAVDALGKAIAANLQLTSRSA